MFLRVSLSSESELQQLDAAIDKIGGGRGERGGGERGAEGEEVGVAMGSLTGCEGGMRAMQEVDDGATTMVSLSMHV